MKAQQPDPVKTSQELTEAIVDWCRARGHYAVFVHTRLGEPTISNPVGYITVAVKVRTKKDNGPLYIESLTNKVVIEPRVGTVGQSRFHKQIAQGTAQRGVPYVAVNSFSAFLTIVRSMKFSEEIVNSD